MPKLSIKESVNEFRRKTNGQVVLVLQGGGALGAYQDGDYAHVITGGQGS